MHEPGAESPSKSARKRELLALQALAADLIALPASRFETLGVEAELAAAIAEGRGLQRAAYRRHLRYVAGMLDRGDPDGVRAALARAQGRDRVEQARQHRAERWRERLVDEGDDAFAAFLAEYPSAERQRLRRLILSVRRERAAGAAPRMYRELFRYLRDLDRERESE